MKKLLPISGYHLWVLLLFALLVLNSAIDVSAQTVTISGLFRPRLEVQYGYKVPPDTSSTPQFLLSQRTRLMAAYNSNRFNAFISIQDARIWGDEVQASDVPSLGLHEAWIQYNFSNKIGLRAGRQELKYDNKRLLTDGDWPQQGRAHDAMVLKLNLDQGWRVDAAASYNQQAQTFFGDYYGLSNYKTLDFLWANKSKTDTNYTYSISGIILGDGYQSPDTSGIVMRYTYGINSSLDYHRWGVNLEGYGQSGKTRTFNQSGNIVPSSFQKISAYMFSVNPWIQATKNLQVGAGIDYLSGSNSVDTANAIDPNIIYPNLDGTTHTFNPAFGAGDKFYGKIDIFVNIPTDTRNGGLIDAYLNLKYTYDNWNFGAAYHYFALQNKVVDVENPGKGLGKTLGSELDFAAIKDITKEINLNTGLALYFPTRSMEFVKASGFSQIGGPKVTAAYFYLMVTFRPVFFSNAK
ncbi:MAG: alginate export family protein [Chitinophagales bacterium]|nr:alginate export family protein [Chitinophagales bacterium]